MLSLTTNIIVLTCCSASSHNASPLSHTPVVARRCCCLLSSSSVSHIAPPPAADGLPATVLLRQLLPAHEALTHRLEGLLRGMRVRLIIWDFCLYCCGSILMRYCFSPSPLFFNIMVGVSVVGWRGSLVPALPQRSTAITSSNSCCGCPRERHQ